MSSSLLDIPVVHVGDLNSPHWRLQRSDGVEGMMIVEIDADHGMLGPRLPVFPQFDDPSPSAGTPTGGDRNFLQQDLSPL
jgi:hypothetical protein